MNNTQNFTFIDLFAGIGGIRLAFEGVGGKCVFSSEWDKYAQQTYKLNFGDLPQGDITKIASKDIPDHDILTGGFPCQPFSSIGQRQGFKHKTQGTLFFDVARIIKDKQPKAFLLENVKGLRTHANGSTYQVIKDTLENELGYIVFDKILNASNYGVPQQRERIYFVGFRKDVYCNSSLKFEWPKESGERIAFGQFVEENPADKYSISKHLQESYLFKKDDGRPLLIDRDYDRPIKTLVASYHKIQRLTGTFVKGGKTGVRLLTEKECKSIMGFPKEYKFDVSRTQMYRQMGNSVAIPVIKKIAKQMISVLEQERCECQKRPI